MAHKQKPFVTPTLQPGRPPAPGIPDAFCPLIRQPCRGDCAFFAAVDDDEDDDADEAEGEEGAVDDADDAEDDEENSPSCRLLVAIDSLDEMALYADSVRERLEAAAQAWAAPLDAAAPGGPPPEAPPPGGESAEDLFGEP